MSFKPDARLDDEEESGHPVIAIGLSAKKPRSAFKPDEPLDGGDSSEEDGSDAEPRFKEAIAIMAKMISAGRVDESRLGRCFREAFQALEEMPHKENEEGEEDSGSEYDKEGN